MAPPPIRNGPPRAHEDERIGPFQRHSEHKSYPAIPHHPPPSPLPHLPPLPFVHIIDPCMLPVPVHRFSPQERRVFDAERRARPFPIPSLRVSRVTLSGAASTARVESWGLGPRGGRGTRGGERGGFVSPRLRGIRRESGSNHAQRQAAGDAEDAEGSDAEEPRGQGPDRFSRRARPGALRPVPRQGRGGDSPGVLEALVHSCDELFETITRDDVFQHFKASIPCALPTTRCSWCLCLPGEG
jgi:hypothetical protein